VSRILSRREWLLIGAGSALNLLAFPPFHLILPSFVLLVPLCWLLNSAETAPRPVAHAARVGFWAGLVTQGVFLYWMVVALWHFTPLSALGYLVSVVVLSGWTAGLAAATVWSWRRLPTVPRWLVFAIHWTTMEWLIGHVPDVQFPWLGLGTSLTGAPVLVQWADFAGARGVTFWLAGVNAALAAAFLQPTRRWRPVATVAATIALAIGYGVYRTRTLVVRDAGSVALIQPNIGFGEKWIESESQRIVDGLLAQSDSAIARGHPDLVIWPEAAVPAAFQFRPQYAAAMAALVRRTRVPLLAGGIAYEPGRDGHGTFYNAAFYFDLVGDWTRHPVYAKRYLVPVVERVPFIPPSLVQRFSRFFGAFGRGRDLPLFPTPVGRAGVVICFESAFEDLSRHYRALGADVLVNITNDAWYGRTTAPAQHAAHLIMRAIETRAGIARAANSGISEVVSPLGVATGMTELESRATVISRLETTDVVPPYVRLGDWVAVLALVGSALLLLASWRAGTATG